jgi:hypothetical protein
MNREYSPQEIIKLLEEPLGAGELAARVAAFWPTIRHGLYLVQVETSGTKVKPIPSGD